MNINSYLYLAILADLFCQDMYIFMLSAVSLPRDSID